jgi:hypothetical protein
LSCTNILLQAEDRYSRITYRKSQVFEWQAWADIMRAVKLVACVSASFCSQQGRSVSIICFPLIRSSYNHVTSRRTTKSCEADCEFFCGK